MHERRKSDIWESEKKRRWVGSDVEPNLINKKGVGLKFDIKGI